MMAALVIEFIEYPASQLSFFQPVHLEHDDGHQPSKRPLGSQQVRPRHRLGHRLRDVDDRRIHRQRYPQDPPERK